MVSGDAIVCGGTCDHQSLKRKVGFSIQVWLCTVANNNKNSEKNLTNVFSWFYKISSKAKICLSFVAKIFL